MKITMRMTGDVAMIGGVAHRIWSGFTEGGGVVHVFTRCIQPRCPKADEELRQAGFLAENFGPVKVGPACPHNN